MALNLGMVRPGSTILVPFHTFTSDDPSASVAIADFVLADIGIYKGTSTVERASTTGVILLDTDGIDVDGAVGIGGFSIDLSSNATAGFYSAGSHYYVTVGPVTIDAATVNFVAATFSIGYPDAILNTTINVFTSTDNFTLNEGSVDDDAYNGFILVAHDVASAVQIQIGVVEDYTGSSKTINLRADPGIFTMTAADNISLLPPSSLTAPAVDDIWDEALTGATHNVNNSSGRRLRQLQEAGGYELGRIWIDTNNGTAGTTPFENGTANNPVDTIADAKTLSANLAVNLSDFHVINGSTITLAESTVNESYFGNNWTLALGGQDCAGAHFEGADLSGIQTGADMSVHNGEFSGGTLATGANFDEVGLTGTIVLAAGSYEFFNCHHDGIASPKLDFGGAIGNTTVHIHNYHGAIELSNFGDNGTDIVHIDGDGKLIINADSGGGGTNGVINLNGDFEIENNAAAGKITINLATPHFNYEGGAIWINTALSNTSTINGFDGTVERPVSTLAAAKTLSTALGISDFHVINGSTITLAETTDNESYFGDNWTLALGGQSIVASYFEGASVTGTGTGVGSTFRDCSISTVTLAACTAVMCRFGNTFTLGAAGEFVFIDCVAELVGANAPVLDFAAVGASTVNYRRYSGGLTVNNLAAGDVLGIEVTSGGPITLNGTAATIALKGNINIVTDNTTSSTVITQGVVNQTTINTEADAALDTTITELSQGVPATNPTMRTAVMLMYMALRNKLDVATSSTDTLEIHNDAGTRIAQKLLTDDGSDYSEAKMSSGA